MTARFADEITQADLFETAARHHYEAIGVSLCPRVPFLECDSRGCVRAREAFGVRRARHA